MHGRRIGAVAGVRVSVKVQMSVIGVLLAIVVQFVRNRFGQVCRVMGK